MRTTIVSTSKLKTYKIITTSILAGIILLMLALTLNIWLVNHHFYGILYLMYVWVCGTIIKRVWTIKNVSYDDSAVYYDREGYEIQVPFEDIRDIEIKTLDGIYKINLFRSSQDGKSIRFKTSLWYPFNSGKQDDMVNVLRIKIAQHKRNLAPNYTEQLPGRRI